MIQKAALGHILSLPAEANEGKDGCEKRWGKCPLM